MGLFDRWGRSAGERVSGPAADPVLPVGNAGIGDDESAMSRYRYMLRTAPPETIEQAHAEAFAQLTPAQRRKVLEGLADAVPESERSAVLRDDAGAASLARAATRAEIRRPGVMERAFGSIGAGGVPPVGAGPGLGGLMAGTLLSSLAGTVLGSVIAQQFFSQHPSAGELSSNGGSGGAGAAESGRIADPWSDASQEDGNADDPGILAEPDADFGGFDDGGSFDV